ncbi:hypothetical protein NHX12_010095, partial [Muraenolepis orangiensis]
VTVHTPGFVSAGLADSVVFTAVPKAAAPPHTSQHLAQRNPPPKERAFKGSPQSHVGMCMHTQACPY